jgi:hypothetical protein
MTAHGELVARRYLDLARLSASLCQGTASLQH